MRAFPPSDFEISRAFRPVNSKHASISADTGLGTRTRNLTTKPGDMREALKSAALSTGKKKTTPEGLQQNASMF